MNAGAALLEVTGLSVDFGVGAQRTSAVRDVDLVVQRGQVMGLVGESGSGKSVTARAVIGLLREPGRVVGGSISFDGADLLRASEKQLREIRGRRIAMVFQDPLSALNPSMRVGEQVAEALTVHGATHHAARKRSIELLDAVGIPGAAERAGQFPHEFSGGMRQRVVIAAALANSPDLLIADEPSTALDVTVQAQILRLLALLRDDFGVATLLITHDLGVVAELCDDVTVMLRGEVVERGTVSQILEHPREDYTRMLLAAVPRLDGPLPARARRASSSDTPVTAPGVSAATPDPGAAAPAATSDAGTGASMARMALHVQDLRVDVTGRTGRRHRPVFAVDGVSLEISPGETLGLVGESGCGKSTLSRAIAGLSATAGGTVALGRDDLTGLPVGHPHRRSIQYVFQDPYSSLNPLRTVRQSIEEAAVAGAESPELLMERVGLDRGFLDRYPAAFSGGQRQRVGIARALAAGPAFLLSDEPVSALDVSIQAQIIELFGELRDDLGIGNLFIAHDLAVVRQISDRVAVMFLGRIVETGSAAEVYADPQHPYTVALLSAAPVPEVGRQREQIVLRGDPPTPGDPPTGCRFASRCPIGPRYFPERTRCLDVDPALAGSASHQAACHFPGELTLATAPGEGAGERIR